MPPQAPDDAVSADQAWRTPRAVAVTARLAAFLGPRMTDLRAAAGVGMPPPSGGVPSRVFVFWAQGFAAAPDVVRACHRRLVHVHGERTVCLTDETVRDLVDLPEHVWRTLSDRRTPLSDVLRLDLLARHGGVWVDATCWAQSDVLAAVQPLAAGGFFAFRRRNRPLSSWLLAAEAGSYTVLLWRQALLEFWQHFDRRLSYFLIHYLFAALCDLDEEFAARWNATPAVFARAPHRFQRVMREPYDEARYRRLLGGSFVHKLTHKVDPAEVGPGTMLGHLLAEADDVPGG